MNRQSSLSEISRLLGSLVASNKASVAAGLTDLPKLSETIFLPVLREALRLPGLRNLNSTERENFPAIDLADDLRNTAIQVTATPTADKVKETLTRFQKHRLFSRYKTLLIFVVTERQSEYKFRLPALEFNFSPSKDILDYRDVYKMLASMEDVATLERVRFILQSNVVGVHSAPALTVFSSDFTEQVALNLVDISLPEDLTLAQISVSSSQTDSRRPRDLVREELRAAGLRFGSDWHYFGGNIITFHNLRDDACPLSRVVDRGTIESWPVSDYVQVSAEHEKAFKALLRFTLQQQLFHRSVRWQNDEKVFIFCGIDGAKDREVTWFGERSANRTVFETTFKKDKPDEILNCKHFAFEVDFHRFGGNWTISMRPQWFFSLDGYRKNPFTSKNVDWLKRHENNETVHNHFRFLAHFLSSEPQADMFDQSPAKDSFIRVASSLETFNNGKVIDDKAWNPSERKQSDRQGELL